MKRGLPVLVAVFAVSIVSLFATEAPLAAKSPRIDAPKSFRGQFTLQVGDNPAEHGTMYYSHGRIREETTPAGGGPKTVTIINPARKMIFLIEADKKSFRVLPWDAESALIAEALKHSKNRKLVGSKTIDGQLCDEFEIVPKESSVRPFSIWINKGTRLPVQLATKKSDPAKTIVINWTDLNPGNQAAVLFDPPLGYQEMK